MTSTYDPERGFPRVVPILLYRDVDAAVAWLARVFGFSVRLRAVAEDGRTSHCDMATGGGGVVMAEPAPEGYQPAPPAGKGRDFVLVVVPDAEAHHRRARREGADVVSAPADRPWGLRQYLVHDLEGHAWEFSQFLRDVPVEQWRHPLATTSRRSE